MAKEVNTRWWPSWISSERVMATFTVVIAVVAFFQWYVFANQLDEMRTDQRAWLSIKAIWATPQLNNAVAAPTVVNDVGKTAAKNVRGWVFVQSVPKNTGLAFDNPTYTEPPIGRSGEPEPAYSRFQIGVMFPNDPTTLHEAVLGERISASASPVATMWTPALKDQFERGEF